MLNLISFRDVHHFFFKRTKKKNKRTIQNRSNELEKTNVFLMNERILQKIKKKIVFFYLTNGFLEQTLKKKR